MNAVTAKSGLARRTLGPLSLLFFTVSASAPMTVLAGSVIATYASTGVSGVPLSFLILGGALLLFSVGYVAMARYVTNAGPFYAFLAQGLGRVWGVAGGLVALLSYNAIQISLYGLLGAVTGGLVGYGQWWVWALTAWAVVALLGVLRISVNARVLAVLLVCEVAMIIVFDLGAFSNPAEGSVSVSPLLPGSLLVSGIGGVMAFGIAAFVGVELAPVYGEEAQTPAAVARATIAAVAFIGILYSVSSWGLAVAVGPGKVVDAARDPNSGLPFSVLEAHFGPLVAKFAGLLLVTSVFAALLSFHGTVARYVFTLARDGVLPAALGRIGSGAGGGAPISGSLIQSIIAFLVIVGFAISGQDPVLTMFTWLSAVAALGIMTLLVALSVAVIGFFRKRSELPEGTWTRAVAPTLGAVSLLAVLVITTVNIGSLLGTVSLLQWVLPAIVVGAALVGLLWGVLLRSNRPEVFGQVGVGLQEPLEALDHSLDRFRM
jgi:amino acid transporter